MLSHGKDAGFEAWVEGRDDKKRLNEYQIEHHPAENGDPAYTECFLETIDEPFRIVVDKLPQLRIKSDWDCTCRVDGINLRATVWPKKEPRYARDHIIQSQTKGGNIKSSFRFAPLATTDDTAAVTLTSEALRAIGTIQIILRRGSYTYSGMGSWAGVAKLQPGIANEKSKKTTDHQAAASGNVRKYSFSPYSGRGMSTYRFLFKYRPRAELVRTRVIDEPEPEEVFAASQAGPSKKRKRISNTIDLTLSGDEDEDELDVKVDVKPELEVDKDIKPNIHARRNGYLEERVQELIAENKRLREAERAKASAVDLTSDD
ncbi:hypothetical protein IAU59_000536 [Kwoniella sp. CBS 9459]